MHTEKNLEVVADLKAQLHELELALRNDDFECKFAMLENDLSNKTAELLKHKEESDDKLNKLQAAVDENLARLKELEESRDKLQAVNMEMAKSQEQLSSENAHLKGEIKSLKLLVKAAEDSLEAEKAEFKKTVEETNIKVNGFLSTRNNLHFALRNHLTSWLTK